MHGTARLKTVGKWGFRRLGYGVYRLPRSDGTAAGRGLDYYQRWSPPVPLFAPWSGHPSFERLYEGVAAHSIVSRDRCYVLASLTAHASQLPGDLVECGVFRGGTALLICKASAGSGKRIYLFDSFEGLPANDPIKDVSFESGQFAADLESVERVLSEFADVVEIHKGWIPDTFARLDDRTYALAHIDVDLYRSALDCCEYFYPRLTAGGVLLFDEYGFADAVGERDAVDEFLADKPESPIVLPTGQAIVLKLPGRG